MKDYLFIDHEVAEALAESRPVVALESTIITHGMPYPQNLEAALSTEKILRDLGVTPATIALMDGKIRVGLNEADLGSLASARNPAKASKADLAANLVQNRIAGTTVAATMFCAHLAGISVFATGGIGGVHRGAEIDFDISADITELASTPVTVICAGAKAILDIPKTLEALETQGVPVIAFGQDDFPAFWSRSSGLAAPIRANSAVEIARMHKLREDMHIRAGQLVGNPIPEHAEISSDVIKPIIAKAVREAADRGIAGKQLTPFLLQKIFEITDGQSLQSNIELVRNNARLAAQIAKELNGFD